MCHLASVNIRVSRNKAEKKPQNGQKTVAGQKNLGKKLPHWHMIPVKKKPTDGQMVHMLGNSSPDRKKPQVRGGETNKQKKNKHNKHRWAKAPKWADTQRESGASKWAGASKRAGAPG